MPVLPVYLKPDITIVVECFFYLISDLAFKNVLNKIMVNEKQTNSMENGSCQTSHDQAFHLNGGTSRVSKLIISDFLVAFATFCTVAAAASNE